MDLERRTRALLQLVEDFGARRCNELLEPARAEARTLVCAALSEARRRVHTAIVEERKRYASEVGAAEAALATERRLTVQRHASELLASAWQPLQRQMAARWAAADTRAQWIETHMARALAAVPHGPDATWLVEHAEAWSEVERADCRERLRRDGVGDVEFAAVATIVAGFRVVCGHNVLDATVDGLTADRARLEGRLLHHLEQVSAA
jgi:hypothetical protein